MSHDPTITQSNILQLNSHKPFTKSAVILINLNNHVNGRIKEQRDSAINTISIELIKRGIVFHEAF